MKNVFIYFLAIVLQCGCHLEKLTPDGNSDADFTTNLSDNDGYAPCKAKFENLSSNGVIFEWDFGDGSAHSAAPNPIHAYPKPGDYLVTLTITDADGVVSSVTKPVTIRARTFKKLIDNFNTWEVNDVIETQKGDFWVVGSGLASGTVDAVAYVMTTDFKGEKNDESYFGAITTGTTALEIIDDLPTYFGTKDDGGSTYPFIYALHPPDVFITQGIPEAQHMVDAVKTSDGFYAFIANTGSQIYMSKPGAFPQVGWSNYLGASGTNGHDLIQTSDGGFAIVGTYTTFLGGGDIRLYVTKLNSAGNTQWVYDSYSVGQLVFWDVAQTTDGQFVVSGGNKMIKFGSNGTKIWEKTFTDVSNFTGIAPSMDNGVVAVGTSIDLTLLKVDQNGNKVWARTYESGWLFDEGRAIHPTSDCGFIVLAAASQSWGYAPFLIKTDAEGLVE